MRTNPAQGQQSPCASGGSGTAAPQGGRKQDGPRTCVYSGRLQKYGKSKRSEAPADGHRSDSPGIFYKFPAQRSSGSVREALRLPRSERLRDAKIFSTLFRCPVHGCRPHRDFFCFLIPETALGKGFRKNVFIFYTLSIHFCASRIQFWQASWTP